MHEGHRKRLRQRFIDGAVNSQQGVSALGEAELTELLLTYAIPRRDVAPIARALIERYGSLRGALAAPKEELESFAGISENTALFLKLVDSVAQPDPVPAPGTPLTRLRSVAEAARYCRTLIGESPMECLLAVLLDDDSKVLSAFIASEGGQKSVALPIELIAANARMHGAAGVVIAHNHPSGDIRPSSEDVDATIKLVSALQAQGARLYEHFIIGGSRCYALLAEEII